MNYERDLKELVRLVDVSPKEAHGSLREMDAHYQGLPEWQRTRVALLIDIGSNLRSEGIIKEGIESAEQLTRDSELCYWIGNAYQMLHELATTSGFDPRITTLPFAKASFREAIDRLTSSCSVNLRAQIWTNYGNTLARRSGIGRNLEAIAAYQAALKFDPEFGMALGNLAIELEDFVHVSYTHGFLEDARECVEKALARSDLELFGGPNARTQFAQARDRIHRHLTAWHAEPTSHRTDRMTAGPATDRVEASASNSTLKAYREWCISNNLFLDFSLPTSRSATRGSDSLFFRSLSGEAHQVFPLFRLLNEIKEAFVSARWFLFSSCVPTIDYAQVDALSMYILVPDYGTYGVRVGTLKASFQLCYDVLDKLGLCLYRRLHLAQPADESRVHFHNIWGRSGLSDEMSKAITEDPSHFLYALYDLSCDLDKKTGYHGKLRKLRNTLTHMYVLPHVELGGWREELDGDDYHIYLPDLREATFQLFALVRAAIVYFVCFVDRQERRASATDHDVLTMPTQLPLYDPEIFGVLGWS